MGIKSDIEDAIHAHGAWKTHFRDFLNGKAGMDRRIQLVDATH